MPPGFPRKRLAIGTLCLGLTGLAACVEPIQNGGVVMYGGESERVAAMCRFRRGAEGKAGFCAPEPEAPAAVNLARIGGDKKPFAGALVEAKAGDVLVDNGAIAAVISASDGALVDAADAEVREDAFGRVATCLGAPLGCLTGVTMSFSQGRDGSAQILARGHAEGDPRVTIATRYMLVPGARVILVSTLIASKADEPVVIPSLGDAVHWGAAEPVPSVGKEPSPPANAVAEAPFAAALASSVAYAIAPAGDRPTLEIEGAAGTTSLRFGRNVTLPPGGSARYERLFVVAPRGDTLGVLTELALVREERVPGAIELRFVDEAGKPFPPPADARVELLSPRDTLVPFLRIGPSVAEAGVAAEAPPGAYELDLRGKGLRALARVPIEVKSGEVTQATIVVGAEPAPVPAQGTPEGGTPAP
ncbi:hypothetical protein [Polyangium jinanense]|uniref:Lipoprotein n=1 Tax=Polyangium jinanense TaxID=2829994 RepID=A0A9X4AQK1_9BACT|nr:hypothetical protein [Polyangium jinanense]MDC3955057.1 hypothetical protein [Polyangium jinanense]MDC3981173.1 hypothetical protein [Polyangium jinanense]